MDADLLLVLDLIRFIMNHDVDAYMPVCYESNILRSSDVKNFCRNVQTKIIFLRSM